MPRLDQLLALLKEDPNDTFLRYGLALEYAKQNRFDDSLQTFRELLTLHPDYVPAHFMAGRTCEQKGDPETAKSFYCSGLAAAQKTNDTHAAAEITEALNALE